MKTKTKAELGLEADGRADDFGRAVEVAKGFLRGRGHLVVDDGPQLRRMFRNPATAFVAWDETTDTMAFVRVVRPRADDTAREVRRQVPTRTRMFKAWREAKRWSDDPDVRWKGNRRFDRVAVYGDERTPTVDWTCGAKGEL